MHDFIMEKPSAQIIARHLKDMFLNLYNNAQEHEPVKNQLKNLLPAFDFEQDSGLDFVYACTYAMGDKITETFLLKVLGEEYTIPQTEQGIPDTTKAQKELMRIWIDKSQTEQESIDNLLEGLIVSNVLSGVLNRLLDIGATEADIMGVNSFMAVHNQQDAARRHLSKFAYLKMLFTTDPNNQVKHLNYFLRMWIGTFPNVKSLNFRTSLNDNLSSAEWLNLFNQYGDDFLLQVLRTGAYDPDKPLSSIRVADLERMKAEEAAAAEAIENAVKETGDVVAEDFLQGDTETQGEIEPTEPASDSQAETSTANSD